MKNSRKKISLLKLAGVSRSRWMGAVGLFCISNILEIVGLASIIPLVAVLAYDGVTSGKSGGMRGAIRKAVESFFSFFHIEVSVFSITAFIAVLFLLRSAVSIYGSRFLSKLIADAGANLRRRILTGLFDLRWEYFRKPRATHLVYSTVGRVNSLGERLRLTVELAATVVQVLLVGSLALMISWVLCAALISVGVAMFLVARLLRTEARRSAKEYELANQKFVHQLHETIDGIQPLKAMGRHAKFQKIFSRQSRTLRRLMLSKVFSSEYVAEFQEPIIALTLCFTTYMGFSVLHLPTHEIFVMGLIMVRVTGGLGRIQQSYFKLQASRSSLTQVTEALEDFDLWREEDSGDRNLVLDGAVTFKNLSFDYGKGPVLESVNLELKARQLNLIAGPSGTGKSTILALLMRLEQPTGGEIDVDGINISELDLQSWRRSIGYLPQEVWLFETSVEENVSLGEPNIGAAEVMRAIRLAGASSFVERLEEGLSTVVTSFGRSLSGGQRQRLGLARALVHKPSLLVLDEPTSGVDPEVTAMICKTVRELVDEERLTVVVVSHDDIWRRYCDHLIELPRQLPSSVDTSQISDKVAS